MRQWFVNPKLMCRQHLLGEHCEIHMFIGSMKKQINMNGYISKDLLEPKSLINRHNELIMEMERRGYNHKSPILENMDEVIGYLDKQKQNHIVNKENAKKELFNRCKLCGKEQFI